MAENQHVSVAILAGGFGTRLASVLPNQQKILAPVNEQLFLKYILNQLNKEGFKEIVLCTGYLSNQVQEKLGKKYKNIDLIYSNEDKPLGTGGALKLALPKLKSEIILAMNGDSFCDINLKKFFTYHVHIKSKATLALSFVHDTSRFGKVTINRSNRIIGFQEKKVIGSRGWVNAGMYLLNKAFIKEIPDNKQISIEKDIFPFWIGKEFYGFKGNHNFIDIGTPESYAFAQQYFKEITI